MHRSAIRKDGPRRIQRSIRDRTVFPRLEFEPLPLVGKQLLPPWWRVGWQDSRVRVGIRGGARANPPRLESRSNRPWMVEPILKFRGVAAGWKSVSPSPEGGWKTRGGIDHRPSVAEQINQAIRYTCHLHVSSVDAPLRKTLETDSPTRSEKRVLYDTGRRKRRNSNSLGEGKEKKKSIDHIRAFFRTILRPSFAFTRLYDLYICISTLGNSVHRSKIERIGAGGDLDPPSIRNAPRGRRIVGGIP